MVFSASREAEKGAEHFRNFPLRAPTPGRLNREKEPDPEKHAFYALFWHPFEQYFPDPLPLAPLFEDSWKKVSRKGSLFWSVCPVSSITLGNLQK